MNLGGDPTQALVHATTTGNFVVSLSSVDLGQGRNTIAAQVAAETLGLPYENIIVDTLEVARRAGQAMGMAVAEVQISETETPLHKLETVYRRVCESLETAEFPPSAFRPVLDAWLFALESEGDSVDALVEKRLAEVSRTTPAFASALRGYRHAQLDGDEATAEGLVAWLGGQPHVAASIRRSAGVRGDLDHFGAFGFLQGLLTVLRDSGHPGLLLVLDEVETLQRVRTDVREKALNALRQLVDEVDGGRFPGLYLLITGTPAFFDGTQGMQRLPPLAQRLATDFTTDARFDNPRAVQIRLPGFSQELLQEVGVDRPQPVRRRERRRRTHPRPCR